MHGFIKVFAFQEVGLEYSGTSDSGPCIITSLQRTQFKVPKICFPMVLIHFEPQKEDNLSTKDTTAEFILSSTSPLLGSTVVPLYINIVSDVLT